MVGDVLERAGRVRRDRAPIVVTNERSVVGGAGSERVLVVPDTVEDGQSAAVRLGIAHALAQGYERVLLRARRLPGA